MKTSMVLSIACAALMGAFITPSARADEWNKKTIFKFSGPVEIPGQVLPAGTYVFKRVDSLSDRHIVQISNERGNHVFATILAIPDYRLEPRGKTILTFEEREAGGPEAIRAWFYPGDNYGDEFVYPKVRAVALAQQNNYAVPSMAQATPEPAPAPAAMAETPVVSQQPTGEEQTLAASVPEPAEAAPAPTPAPAAEPAPLAPAPEQAPAQLPQTGSNLPLIGLAGLTSLILAASINRASRKA